MAALALVTASAFAACSGLDDRKVSRGPDVPAGGDGSGNTGNESGTSNTGNEPSVGGSDSRGGEGPTNPFGGDTFTGGAPPVLDGPPEVLNVDPEADRDDADPSGVIQLLFSEGSIRPEGWSRTATPTGSRGRKRWATRRTCTPSGSM